jgi:hypothetical protein
MFGTERLDEAFRRLGDDHMVFLEKLFVEIEVYLDGQPPFDGCTAIIIDFYDALLHEGN